MTSALGMKSTLGMTHLSTGRTAIPRLRAVTGAPLGMTAAPWTFETYRAGRDPEIDAVAKALGR
jgi:hypothetical protein